MVETTQELARAITQQAAEGAKTAARLQAITTAYQEQIREIGALNQTIQQRDHDSTT